MREDNLCHICEKEVRYATPEVALCILGPFHDYPKGGHFFAGCPTCSVVLEKEIKAWNDEVNRARSIGFEFLHLLYDRGKYNPELFDMYNEFLDQEYPKEIDGYVDFLKKRLNEYSS